MKKLNKKGFTLIELMVVIAILVIIMGIALPNITSSIERSKQKQIDNKRQLIVSAGELYFDRYKKANRNSGVTLRELVSKEFLTSEEIKDSCSEKNEPDGCCVMYDTTNGYYFVDNVQDCSMNGAIGSH